jgi:hypothetical protein
MTVRNIEIILGGLVDAVCDFHTRAAALAAASASATNWR